MAKKDLSVVLLDEKGQKLGATKQCYVLEPDKKTIAKQGEGYLMATITDPTEEVSVKSAIIESLLSDASDNPQAGVPSEEKAKRFAVFFKISQSKDDTKIDLSSDEIVLIKKVCWLAKPTLIAGQIDHILEG